MIKEVITNLINKVLGKFIVNFDPSQFTLGLSGKISVQDLEIKHNCFDELNLNLPVKVLYGKIGKLLISLSYLKLFSTPSTIVIEDLFLLVVPNQNFQYDEEVEKKQAQEAKERQLQMVEEAKKKELEKAQGIKKPPVDMTFVEKMVSALIKNIEITVKNIHVRFEDRISNPRESFAFGLTLSSLQVKTVPPWGKPKTDPVNLIFKELSIQWLSLYWNCKEQLYQRMMLLSKKKEMDSHFAKGIGSPKNVPVGYKYLLGPINAKSNLQINLRPELDGSNFAVPKFCLRFDLESLLVCMDKSQFQDLVLFLENLSFMSAAEPYRKYRPSVSSYKGHAAIWWKYAYDCVTDGVRRRKREWDWSRMQKHRHLFRDYKAAYTNKLKGINKADLKCKIYEEQLDVFNIVLARQMAERELAQEGIQLKDEQKKKPGYFSRWFGGGGSTEEAVVTLPVSIETIKDALSPEEKEEMYKAIGYTEGEVPTDYPDFFVVYDVGANIHRIEIQLVNENNSTIMKFMVKEALAAINQRPSIKSLTVNFSIEQITIIGLDQQDTTPMLLTTKTSVSKEKPLIAVLFEINPLDNRNLNQRIHVDAEPLLIMYDALTINNLIDLFKVEENTVTSKIQAAAQAKLQEFKEVSALGLQNLLEHHITMEIVITIQASSVLIPQTGFFSVGCPVLAVTLGNIKVMSLPRKELQIKEAAKTMDTNSIEYLMLYSYDNFELQLTDLQVVFANSNEAWHEPVGDMYFLTPTSLIINLGKCLVCDDHRLPKLKVMGQLNQIHVAVSELRLKDCLSLLMSLPLPKSDSVEVKGDEISHRLSMASLSGLRASTNRLSFDSPASLVGMVPIARTPSKKSTSEVIQAYEIDAKFELREARVDILAVKDHKTEELLQFRLDSLGIVYAQHTFMMTVRLKLGSVQLRHHFEEEWLNVITTYKKSEHEDYLFSVNYKNVNKNIPEFHTKFNSTLQLVEIDFTKLELMLHCEALKALIFWAEDFQKLLASNEEKERVTIQKKPSLSLLQPRPGSPDFRSSLGRLSSAVRISHVRRPAKVDEIKFKVKAHLGEIGIKLWKSKSHLASLGVKGGECVLSVRAPYTQVDLKLMGIYLLNHDDSCLYKKILTTNEKTEVLSLRFVLFEQTHKKHSGIDMSVDLSMTAIRFVFINKFIMSLLDFLNRFSAAREAIIDASAAAAEAAKQNVQSAIENAIKISLKIDLEAPKIIIPASSSKYNALILDLGQLTASNSFFDVKVPNSDENAVLDRLNIELHNIQLNHVLLHEDLNTMIESNAIIEPINFVLTVQRNLSSGWFLDVPDIEIGGKLKKIKVTFNKKDYILIMDTLEGNLGEKGPEKEGSVTALPPAPQPRVTTVVPKRSLSVIEEDVQIFNIGSPTTIARSTVKFTLTLESMVLELINVDLENPATKEGLSKLSLELVSMKGSIMSDGSLHVAIILLDFMMDDTRPTKIGKITRYMQRKKDPKIESGSKSMIDITYQQKPDAKFADVRISSIDLILNLEHLTQVADFFSKLAQSPPATVEDIKVHTKPAELPKKKEVVPDESTEMSRFSINFKVEHPDIILVENIDDIETNALVLDFELTLTVNMGSEKSLITGSLSDLQLFTCCYNPAKRKETKVPVLTPVTFLVAGCGDDGNTRIELDATRIKVSVTPGIIMLLSKVVSSLSISPKASDEEEIEDKIDRSNMWEKAEFVETDYAFLDTEIAGDALEEMEFIDNQLSEITKEKKVEIFSLKIIQFMVTLETGFGRSTIPLMLLDSSLEVVATDWSSKLHVDAKLFLEMRYYNSYHAMWEPLLEPVTHTLDNLTTKHTSWRIMATMENVKQEELDDSLSITEVEVKEKKALTLLSIHSEEALNLTVSKKTLEVLKGLQASLSAAIFKPEEYEGEKSPYVVKNESGISIKILLDDEFVVYSQSEEDQVHLESIVLDHDSYIGLKSSSEIEYLGLSDETKEKYIHLQAMNFNYDFHLPVLKSAKRFFHLGRRGPRNEEWGLVTDVMITNGQTTVILRGIIQVENLYTVPINVYSMTDKENELHLIGTMQPNETLNLPLEAIYTQTAELFFSADGYTVSIVPYVWKDLQNCIQKSKVLKCNSKYKANHEPLFMRVEGELEQIFYGNTPRHTMLSTCFKLTIRPTVTFKNFLPVDAVVLVNGIQLEHSVESKNIVHLTTAEPGVSSVVIRIPDYLDREWSCKHELLENPPDLSVWIFDSYESEKHMALELGMHMELAKGTHVYSLYCPFWIINRTGQLLAYKRSSKAEKESSSPEHEGESPVLFHPPDYTGAIMFSFRAKSFFVKKKTSIKVEGGQWSDKFSIDAVGSSGVVICKTENMTYNIGVKIQLSNNPLTKVVIFTPFYVFINNFKRYSIDIREVVDGKHYDWLEVPPEGSVPFWPRGKPDNTKLEVRITNTAETSILFPYNKSHNTVLKIANKHGAIDVDVQLSEGGVYINFYPYEIGMAPVLILNHTNHGMDFCDRTIGKDHRQYLKPRQKVLFTWGKVDDNPQISFCKNAFTTQLKEDNMGTFVNKDTVVYWSSFLYGPQRVFLITDSEAIAAESINLAEYEAISQDIEVRLKGIGLSLVDNDKKCEILFISISCSDVVWEARKPDKKIFKKLSAADSAAIEDSYQSFLQSGGENDSAEPVIKVNNRITVDFRTMMMTSPTKKDIRRTYVDGFWVNMKLSAHLTRIHLKINSFQIDQQVYDCVFPVLFSPVLPPKSVMNVVYPKPFIEISIVQLINQFSHLNQFKYVGILIQEFHLRVDTGVVANLLAFVESHEAEDGQFLEREEELKKLEEPLYFYVTVTAKQEQKNYYSKLHLSPLKLHISFSLSSGGDSGGEFEKNIPPILQVFLNSFGVTLTDVDDVVLKINCFERDALYVTQSQLTREVTSHYINQILQQFYVLIFGLDVIGNPFGLLAGFKTGATDLFYEPFQGAIRGPGEFAEGLVLGVRSLVGHTVGGAAGAVSKMTGALGKGLAALTFDDEYQRHRREMQRSKPATMQEGFARSGKGLVMGVLEGVGGVVTKPISGAKEEGVSGFFKGVGKGMVGLITRPTAGIVDFASGSLGAVRRATEYSNELPRKRVPRYIRPDGLIKPYCPQEAEGNKFLKELDKGKFSKTDEYIFHMPIGYASKFKDILLFTDHRMIYLAYNEIFGGYQLEWGHKWTEILKEPEIVKEGIKFWVDKKPTLKTFFTTPDTGKLLFISTHSLKTHVLEVMKQLINKNSTDLQLKGSTTSIKSGEVLQWIFFFALVIIRGESNILNFWISKFPDIMNRYRNR